MTLNLIGRENRIKRIRSLAEEILEIGKNRLLLNMRFFNQALWQLKPEETEKGYFATDGNYLYYPPETVLGLYREDQGMAARMWLHPLMHCLFLHMFVDSSLNRDIWNLSCDIAVEAMIFDLGFYHQEESIDRMRMEVFKTLKDKVSPLTAEKIYRFLLDETINPEIFAAWQQLFLFDSHKLWYEKKSQSGFSSKKIRKNRMENLMRGMNRKADQERLRMQGQKYGSIFQNGWRVNFRHFQKNKGKNPESFGKHSMNCIGKDAIIGPFFENSLREAKLCRYPRMNLIIFSIPMEWSFIKIHR